MTEKRTSGRVKAENKGYLDFDLNHPEGGNDTRVTFDRAVADELEYSDDGIFKNFNRSLCRINVMVYNSLLTKMNLQRILLRKRQAEEEIEFSSSSKAKQCIYIAFWKLVCRFE
jgi:hypothetical protein